MAGSPSYKSDVLLAAAVERHVPLTKPLLIGAALSFLVCVEVCHNACFDHT